MLLLGRGGIRLVMGLFVGRFLGIGVLLPGEVWLWLARRVFLLLVCGMLVYVSGSDIGRFIPLDPRL